jgi:hypothetical protein
MSKVPLYRYARVRSTRVRPPPGVGNSEIGSLRDIIEMRLQGGKARLNESTHTTFEK